LNFQEEERGMSQPEAIFKIIEENNCPLYEMGDEFRLTGKAMMLGDGREKKFISTAVIKIPSEKPICRILVADITAVLIEYGSMRSVPKYVTNCSGCTGLIKIEYSKGRKPAKALPPPAKETQDIGFATKLLNKFPIFQTLDESDIKKLVPLLKMKKFARGAVIMKKGDSATNLYIVISGRAEVMVDEAVIGVMERGEVFGEISLLIGTPVGATIRVEEMVTVLFIYGKDFKKVLNMFPSLQMFFARLLAQRLAKTNVERLEEFASGMVGRLSENPPSELMQTLNLNHKTGVLTLTLPRGTADLSFREGALVSAKYNNKEGKEAFFEVLKEKEGRFKFSPGLSPQETKAPELGDFMWLLMEGVRRMDEDG
jgi:CRP/FNR family transcriptional regulator, cyclic AMP receptor protein